MHLRPAARQEARQVAQEPAQGLVRERHRRHDQRRLRGDVPSQAAAAVDPGDARLRLHADVSVPRAVGADAHASDRHRAVHVRRREAERVRSSSCKNPHYWKKGLPYLDGIEYTIIKNRATAVLAFVAGKVDVTFPTEMTTGARGRHQEAGSDGDLRDRADQRQHQSHRQPRQAAVRQSRSAQGDGDVARPQGLHRPDPAGPGRRRAARCCRRRKACGACRPRCSRPSPATATSTRIARRRAAIMKKLGYGPDKPLKIKVSTRNLATYRDPAVVLIDQFKSHLDRRRTGAGRIELLVRQGRARRLRGRPQPDRQRHRRSRPVVLRELRLRLAAQLHALLQQGPAEAVRPAVAGNRPRQAQEAGVGDRQEDPGGRGAADPVPRPRPAPAGSPTSRT